MISRKIVTEGIVENKRFPASVQEALAAIHLGWEQPWQDLEPEQLGADDSMSALEDFASPYQRQNRLEHGCVEQKIEPFFTGPGDLRIIFESDPTDQPEHPDFVKPIRNRTGRESGVDLINPFLGCARGHEISRGDLSQIRMSQGMFMLQPCEIQLAAVEIVLILRRKRRFVIHELLLTCRLIDGGIIRNRERQLGARCADQE